MLRKSALIFWFFCAVCAQAVAQDGNIRLSGRVTDEMGKPMALVNVLVVELNTGTVTGDDGRYQLELPVGRALTIRFQYIGYETAVRTLRARAATNQPLDVVLKLGAFLIDGISVEDRMDRATNMVKIDPKISQSLANPSGNFEMILQGLGARSSQELSSQYSVRGGNFDENLIYVNDIEIYRPVLMRSGQQEGMSFINPDMVGSIAFSAGGFEARYGDKMSSVLDVRYRKPTEFRVGTQASLLGAGLTVEGVDSSKRFTYLIGSRYRTLSYLLGSLDTRGEYFPSAGDVQGYFTFTPNKRWEFGFLANYNQNDYRVVPANRETVFGTVKEALQ